LHKQSRLLKKSGLCTKSLFGAKQAKIGLWPKKTPAAVALGKLGASKGGKARRDERAPEQRSEIARRAAKARWAKKLLLAPAS
jgi:hypothetical protein